MRLASILASRLITFLTIVACCLIVPPTSAQQILGGINDLSNPQRPPSSSVGVDNSWYIDFLTGNVFGPKNLGQWPATPNAQIPVGTINFTFSAEGNILVAGTNGIGIRDSGTQLLKTYIGSVSPTSAQDSSQGYSVGSFGVNTTTGAIFVAKSVAPGAAQWTVTSIPGLETYIAATDPTSANDNTQGYSVGSIGINTVSGRTFIAKAVTTGAAVWVASGLPIPNTITGNWYLARGQNITAASTAIGSTTLVVLTPFFIDQPQTINGLGTRISTIGSSNFQIAVYASSPTTNLPTGLPRSTTTDILDTSTGAVSQTLASAFQLPAGMYWSALEVNDTAAVFVGPATGLVSTYVGASSPGFIVGGATTYVVNCISAPTSAYGTWPDLTAATFTYLNAASKCGILTFRTSSVP